MGPEPLMPEPAASLPRHLTQHLSRPLSLLLCLVLVALAGCQRIQSSAESQRLNQLELKIQQLESRLNRLPASQSPAANNGKLPVGAVKSLTYRTSDQGNRLRIYWADGSVTDLECNQEQATLACG